MYVNIITLPAKPLQSDTRASIQNTRLRLYLHLIFSHLFPALLFSYVFPPIARGQESSSRHLPVQYGIQSETKSITPD